ncbi:MAG: sulfotransferase, partial [Rubripirellula sp.]
APRRIASAIPNVKLIILLRHPVDRAYSGFCHYRGIGAETRSDFVEVMRSESSQPFQQDRHHFPPPARYLWRSLYSRQVEKCIAAVGRERVHVAIFEELFRNKELLAWKKLYAFLGLDLQSVPVIPASNSSRHASKVYEWIRQQLWIKRLLLATLPNRVSLRLIDEVKARLSKPVGKLDDGTRKDMMERYFAEDVAKLETLLKQPITTWK